MSEKERSRAKFLARQGKRQLSADEIRAAQRHTRAMARNEKRASREEQHARYLDCGPLAWDDIGASQD